MTFLRYRGTLDYFSLRAARLVEKEQHVVAFEADPEIAARLREHVGRNSG
jgi:hypothetical protein